MHAPGPDPEIARRAWSRTLAMALAAAMIFGMPVAARDLDRAVWTWEGESYAMVEDTATTRDATAFLGKQAVNIIYLYADAYGGRNLLVDDPDAYRQQIRRIHRRGMKVYALLGSAHLRTEEYVRPERRNEARAMLSRVLDYNAAAAPNERFDGINLDIEPHLLPDWPDNREVLLEQFLDLGKALMRMKHASGQSLPIGPAIPFWLDGVTLHWNGSTKPVSEHAIDLYDYVAVMDYRHRVEGRDGMIEHVRAELDYARRHGKRVVVGVEVSPNELDKVTFAGKSRAQFERALEQTAAAFRGNPAFAGFAIHHYRSYRTWLDRQDE